MATFSEIETRMSISSKGARTITVDGTSYLWRIRKKPTYSQAAFLTPITIAIQQAETPHGCVLLVELPLSRPDNWISPHNCPIQPATVRDLIRKALESGWKPQENGSAFRLHISSS